MAGRLAGCGKLPGRSLAGRTALSPGRGGDADESLWEEQLGWVEDHDSAGHMYRVLRIEDVDILGVAEGRKVSVERL